MTFLFTVTCIHVQLEIGIPTISLVYLYYIYYIYLYIYIFIYYLYYVPLEPLAPNQEVFIESEYLIPDNPSTCTSFTSEFMSCMGSFKCSFLSLMSFMVIL